MNPHPSEQHSPKALERFVFFSDAVFAFALTLLAVELRLPPHEGRLTAGQLGQLLLQASPQLFLYAFSFFLVASFWSRHHRLFERVQNYDGTLVVLNFLMLFFVSLVPFTIELLGAVHVDATNWVMAAYTGLVSTVGLALLALWWRLQRVPGLLAEPLTGTAFRLEFLRMSLLPIMGLILGVLWLIIPRAHAKWIAVPGLIAAAVSRLARRLERKVRAARLSA